MSLAVRPISSLPATWTKNSKPWDSELVNRKGQKSADWSSWVLLDSPVLAVPAGPPLSLSQPGCDKPQCWSHLCKPTEFPASPPTRLLSATSANLFILFLFFSFSLSLGSHLLFYLPPNTPADLQSSVVEVWWLICYLGILGSLLFSRFTQKNRTEPTQRREEMGACWREGMGQKSKSCYGKIQGRCCCPSSHSETKAIPKATMGRKRSFD